MGDLTPARQRATRLIALIRVDPSEGAFACVGPVTELFEKFDAADAERARLTAELDQALKQLAALSRSRGEALTQKRKEEREALRIAAAALERRRDGVAWLIERNVNGYPEWVSRLDAHSDDCVVSWTRDANLAIRFTRRLDCDRILPALGGRFGRVFPTEHAWIDENADIGDALAVVRRALGTEA